MEPSNQPGVLPGFVSPRQFWKEQPNQLSFPGLEGQAHPGAKLLAEGTVHHFSAQSWAQRGGPAGAGLYARNSQGEMLGRLDWMTDPASKGEIANVETSAERGGRGKGIATALYGMGRQLASVKPQHSGIRTSEGSGWARHVSRIHGGKVPPLLMELPSVDEDESDFE